MSSRAEETKIWIPSYDRIPGNDDTEVPHHSLLENLIIGGIWAGVYLTLPVSYFFVWKKPKENEKILVQRLGRLQPPSKSNSITKLPFIDSEISINMSLRVSTLENNMLITLDKAAVIVKAVITWRVNDAIAAHKSAVNYETHFNNMIGVKLRKRIERTVLRCVATEREQLERNIAIDFDMEAQRVGICVEKVSLEIVASPNQPYLQPQQTAQINLGPDPMADGIAALGMSGFGDAIQSAGSALPPNMMEDIIKGLANHPGFNNILKDYTPAKSGPSKLMVIPSSISAFVDFFKSKSLKFDGIFDIIVDDQCIRLTQENVELIEKDAFSKCSNAEITTTSEILSSVISQTISYVHAYQSGGVTFTGDSSIIRDVLRQIQ